MSLHPPEQLELGLGTIGLGRPWPAADDDVPTAEHVAAFLQAATDLGVRLIDTAPAYGSSEARLGAFLATLARDARDRLFVCTKFGEEWSAEGGSVVDHSESARQRSLERSLKRLGRIDLLQIHKCSLDVLADRALLDWLVELRSANTVGAIGASVSDTATLAAALDLGVFDSVQMPANRERPDLALMLAERGGSVVPLLNRPFGSGSITPGVDAFSWLRRRVPAGVVLSGTTSLRHLSQNLDWMAAG